MEKVKGYKVFEPDFTCRDFKYEVGKTYKHKGSIGLCEAGFHFCSQLKDCFNYYSFNPDNKVAEIVASGEVIVGNDKSVTNTIKIVREISWSEVLELVNTGKANTGLCNTGDWNTGDWNTGNRNTGLFNSCNYSNGLFNSKSPKIYMFNKPTKLTYEELQEKYPEAYNLLYYSSFKLTEWIPDYNMSDEEKIAHPEYKTTGGYLKRNDFKEVCQKMWDSFDKTERNKIKKLPNFDKDVFKEITGIEV